MEVNITLPTNKGNITFYTINALGPNNIPNSDNRYKSIIYSNGLEFLCTQPLEEVWSKLNNIRNENNK